MSKFDMTLRPIHYACVSGGKDSLFMLNLILHNLDKYPLDMIVNFELEIDWPFAKNVVDYIERESTRFGIKFVRIKPRKSWEEIKNDIETRLHRRSGLPTVKARWCNSKYKLDCELQLHQWIKEQNCRPVAYIGFCVDEQKRFKYPIGQWKEQSVCYPLAEENIYEDTILEWAKNVDLFEGWYTLFRRQGCMYCPMTSLKELAYMKMVYPDNYNYFVNEIKKFDTEYDESTKKAQYYFGKPIEEIDKIIDKKWIPYIKGCLSSKIKRKKLF